MGSKEDNHSAIGDEVNPVGDAKRKISHQINSRRRTSSSEAKAELEKDLEQSRADRNTERFLFCMTIVTIFDAIVFMKYENWAQAVCLTVIEAGGLFVLARYLEVDEFISIMVEGIQRIGKTESKKEVEEEDDPKAP